MTDVERLADQAADILAKAREAALEPNARKTLRKFSRSEEHTSELQSQR